MSRGWSVLNLAWRRAILAKVDAGLGRVETGRLSSKRGAVGLLSGLASRFGTFGGGCEFAAAPRVSEAQACIEASVDDRAVPAVPSAGLLDVDGVTFTRHIEAVDRLWVTGHAHEALGSQAARPVDVLREPFQGVLVAGGHVVDVEGGCVGRPCKPSHAAAGIEGPLRELERERTSGRAGPRQLAVGFRIVCRLSCWAGIQSGRALRRACARDREAHGEAASRRFPHRRRVSHAARALSSDVESPLAPTLGPRALLVRVAQMSYIRSDGEGRHAHDPPAEGGQGSAGAGRGRGRAFGLVVLHDRPHAPPGIA